MLVDGEIVERGKHDELLARRGTHYELCMKQFRREEPVSPLASVAGMATSRHRCQPRRNATMPGISGVPGIVRLVDASEVRRTSEAFLSKT